MNRLTLCASALALSAVLAGCGEGEDENAELVACAREAAAAAGYTSEEGGELHIYSWADYFEPEVITAFEQALGVKVVIDSFESNEAMYAKLKAGGAGYDLITPSSYLIPLMAKEGMVDPIDHARCPNVRKNFDPSFVSQIVDPTLTYNVPYAVSYTGLMYAKDKIPAGADINSWAILGNPALKGRISLLDDMREVIGAGLMYRGYSINSTNAAEIAEAVDQILAWRENVRKFDAESYRTEVPNGMIWVGHGYSQDSAQAIVGDEETGAVARTDLGFALPMEGFAIACDELVVAAAAKRKDLAYAFINYLYESEPAKLNMAFFSGPCPVKPGIDTLDPDLRELIILDSETLEKGQTLRNLDDQPEVMDLYNDAWDKIRAVK